MAIIDNRTSRGWLLPHPDNKLKDDVPRLIAALEAADGDVTDILLALAGKAASDHTHGLETISGLEEALEGKISVGYHDAFDDLSDVNVTGAADGQVVIRQAGTWIPINLQIGNITNLETIIDAKAPLANPTFTGIPAGPTAAPGTNTTQLATTGFVTAAIAAIRDGVAAAYDTFAEVATALNGVFIDIAAHTTALADRVAYSVQSKTAAQKAIARLNIDAGLTSGRRNKVDNPIFQVWQRGGSRSATGYCADRWRVSTYGSGATGTLVSLSPENPIATQYGLRNIFAWDRTAGTTLSRLMQSIEGVQTLAGREVTMAVMAYATAPAAMQMRVDQNFGSGGSGTEQGPILIFNLTTAPQIFYHKFTLGSMAGKTLGASNCLELLIDSPVSGAWGIRLLGVALVDGDAVGEGITIFGANDFTDELQHCQRFFEVGRSRLMCSPVNIGISYFKDVQFKATKRVAPSVLTTLYDSAYFPGVAGNAGSITIHGFTHDKTANGNDPRGYFGDDWTADAEFY